MYRASNFLKHLEHLRQRSGKWFERQTKKEILLPAPVAIAKERLQQAFASPISISKGFLYATQKYEGQINENNEIEVQFTIRGRSNMRYSMRGQLLPDPKGSRLVMIVRDKSSLLLILAFILLIFFIAQPGIKFGIIVAILFFPLLLVALNWHRNSAANSISELIYKIVSGQA